MKLRTERNTADSSSYLVAVCLDCAKRGQGGVIGEVPNNITGIGLRAHQTIWQDHANWFGHHVDVVYHQGGGTLAYEIEGLLASAQPRSFTQVVYTRNTQ